MGSDIHDIVVDRANTSERSYQRKKNAGKVPRKIHKAEREKLKRDHMNELFLDLAKALDLDLPNNGKASILKDTIRLIGELVTQVDSLQKENAALLSESNYVTTEKQELEDDNSALYAQIKRLQSEMETRVNCLNLDNPQPPGNTTIQQPEEHIESASASVVGPVYIVPLHHDSQAYPDPCTEVMMPKVLSNVSRPRPRYPSPSYSWPSDILSKRNNVAENV